MTQPGFRVGDPFAERRFTLEEILAAVRSAATPEERSDEGSRIAELASVVRMHRPRVSRPIEQRIASSGRRITTRLAAAVVVTVLTAGSSLALTGELPQTAKDAASGFLAKIGVPAAPAVRIISQGRFVPPHTTGQSYEPLGSAGSVRAKPAVDFISGSSTGDAGPGPNAAGQAVEATAGDEPTAPTLSTPPADAPSTSDAGDVGNSGDADEGNGNGNSHGPNGNGNNGHNGNGNNGQNGNGNSHGSNHGQNGNGNGNIHGNHGNGNGNEGGNGGKDGLSQPPGPFSDPPVPSTDPGPPDPGPSGDLEAPSDDTPPAGPPDVDPPSDPGEPEEAPEDPSEDPPPEDPVLPEELGQPEDPSDSEVPGVPEDPGQP